jgi:hypothetical protein
MNEAEVQRAEKVRAALEILSGVRDAYDYWGMFCPGELKPERDGNESLFGYHHRVGYGVKQAACKWLSEKI